MPADKNQHTYVEVCSAVTSKSVCRRTTKRTHARRRGKNRGDRHDVCIACAFLRTVVYQRNPSAFCWVLFCSACTVALSRPVANHVLPVPAGTTTVRAGACAAVPSAAPSSVFFRPFRVSASVSLAQGDVVRQSNMKVTNLQKTRNKKKWRSRHACMAG